jgi:hypothetical protein
MYALDPDATSNATSVAAVHSSAVKLLDDDDQAMAVMRRGSEPNEQQTALDRTFYCHFFVTPPLSTTTATRT